MTRRAFLVACLLVAGVAGSGERMAYATAPTTLSAKAQPRRIVDSTGRAVTLPEHLERIGCLIGGAYEKAFLFGVADKVVVRAATSPPPWMTQTNPRAAEIPTMRDSHNPNIEELLRLKLDVLFFWDDPEQVARLERSGIVVVSPQLTNHKDFSSPEEFVARFKADVVSYGNTLGGPAAAKVRAWSDYVDQRVRYVQERLARLAPTQKPRTYYVRGPDALTTHGKEQNISWLGEMAGADMVVRRSSAQNIAKVSIEQIMLWNPEVIFVGRQYSPDIVLKDPRWRHIAAVKNGRVHVIPDGVFFWDGGSEGILLLQFLAQKLHPELFPDLDMRRETMNYYKNFYGYPMRPDEADRLLSGRGPDGQRHNSMNN
jgi:iron complex transport system substrate-binding protein